ncbi:hypothetical protein MIT9_P0910 [Methylomarinovum caldicuralii]|uniref:Radical SAM core domain-containing protein n=1 Tax=Methylomarinovum caldicuralii TaxID=438856 RepID=A0AAU9BZ16_9GAMM|nr:radical SAM protein [Methylomarinovum caldicuralii]BCX81332.1 hypothetical protein MIT9_P0910 [Methylomarinovum caldicuralii]
MAVPLRIDDHRRDSAGFTYVYPVVSRRAGGVSIGINFNPNSACNWRCIYCQVPGLSRGAAPPLDHPRLRRELKAMLDSIVHGDFYRRFQVPASHRRICDVAISGNGEPTTLKDFDAAIDTVLATLTDYPLPGLARVIISNGSRIHQPAVQRGLGRWGRAGGVLWFKLDLATRAGIAQVNQIHLSPPQILERLEQAAGLCPVWIQTCWFALDGHPPPPQERQAYLELLAQAKRRGLPLEGVLLYGLARPSRQPQASRLSRLPAEILEELAADIRRCGWPVRVTP